jgi:hypothetical protein
MSPLSATSLIVTLSFVSLGFWAIACVRMAETIGNGFSAMAAKVEVDQRD